MKGRKASFELWWMVKPSGTVGGYPAEGVSVCLQGMLSSPSCELTQGRLLIGIKCYRGSSTLWGIYVKAKEMKSKIKQTVQCKRQ